MFSKYRQLDYDAETLDLNARFRRLNRSTPAFNIDSFNDGVSPNSVGGTVTPTFESVQLEGRKFTIKDSDNIQNTINKANSEGGGIVLLQNGTYVMDTDIVLYSNVELKAESFGSVTIDFNSTANQIKIEGSDAYSAGTVSVNNGSTTVTGSGTTWTSNVSAGQSILISGIWYVIASVNSNTELSISIPFATGDVSGVSYVVATPIFNSRLTDLLIKGSNLAAIKIQYFNDCIISSTDVQTSASVIDADDGSQISISEGDYVANNSGVNFTNVHFTEMGALGIVDSLVGVGFTLDTVTNSSFSNSFILNSAGDGLNLTDCNDISINAVSVKSNGGQGMEFASGCSDIAMDNSAVEDNASDGIKLTDTIDNLMFSTNFFRDNGGYGINIANSNCDDNNITGNNFSGNSSGAVNDSGTGTLIRGNVGVDDNNTSNILSAFAEQYLGDGHDGSETISMNTQLAEDKYYTDLTIDSGAELDPNGYKIFCTGTLTVDNGKIIRTGNNGSAGSNGSGTGGAGGAGGSAPSAGSLAAAQAGADGGDGGDGAGAGSGVDGGDGGAGNGSSIDHALGKDGTDGGTGGSGGDAPTGGNEGSGGSATGGTANDPTRSLIFGFPLFEFFDVDVTGDGIVNYNGSGQPAGGGGGGGGGEGGAGKSSSAGGGGGGAGSEGGQIVIYAKDIVVNASGSIESNGGDGANGGNGEDNYDGGHGGGGGGGAGGNGGTIVLIYTSSYTNNGTVQATGGTAGAGGSGGTGTGPDGSDGNAGNAGSAGTIIQKQIV